MRFLRLNPTYILLATLIAMLLTACGATSIPSTAACPVIPEMPLLSESHPSQQWSKIVQQDLSRWQVMLTSQ